MNKKYLIIGALVIAAGAFFFFQQKPSEHSDLVIVHEFEPPTEAPSAPAEPLPTENSETNSASSHSKDEPIKLTPELEEVLDSLPSNNDLRDLTSDEVHHTPKVVKDGGVAIGEAISRATEDTTLREPTLHFLLQCAEKDGTVPALRAVCWNQLLNKIPAWNIFIPISDAKVSEDIKNLASKLE